MIFALIVTGKENSLQCEGDKFWVIKEPEGWVEATSVDYRGPGESIPRDVKLFESPEAAERFANRWTGHPWWCMPIRGKHEIVEVEPYYRQVLAGYRPKAKT